MEGMQGARDQREGGSRSPRMGDAAKQVPNPSEASSDAMDETATNQEKRSADGQPTEVPPAKQRVVEGETDDCEVVADEGDQVSADLDAVLAAFKRDFRQELVEAMPGMVQRSLTKSLEPIFKKQKEMADTQTQMRKDIILLREGQAKQSIDMAAQIEKLTKAVQELSASGARAHQKEAPEVSAQGASHRQSQRAAASGSAHHDTPHVDPDDEPHEEVVVLVFFPMDGGNTMMKTQYQQVMSKFASPAARSRAKPRIGQTGNTFGIRFDRRSHAQDLVDALKSEGHTVNNIAAGTSFKLDAKIAGPKGGDKSRGQLNSKMYKIAEAHFGQGRIGQKHDEEEEHNWTKISISDAEGWVQHLVTIHYGRKDGALSIVKLDEGPLLSEAPGLAAQFREAAGLPDPHWA